MGLGLGLDGEGVLSRSFIFKFLEYLTVHAGVNKNIPMHQFAHEI